jgi:hypothetical protein
VMGIATLDPSYGLRNANRGRSFQPRLPLCRICNTRKAIAGFRLE